MRSSRTASRDLSAPPGAVDLLAAPLADGQRRVRGVLLDLGPAELTHLPGVTEEVELLARRWRASTGSKPELHCTLDGGGLGSLRPTDLGALAPAGVVARVASVTDLHLWLASPLLESAEVAATVWGVGASLGRVVVPDERGRMARGLLAVPVDRLGDFVRPSFFGRTLVRGVDDERAARSACSAGAWRLSGGAVGEPLRLDEWGWWAAGLGCRTSPHAPVRRAVRRARSAS